MQMLMALATFTIVLAISMHAESAMATTHHALDAMASQIAEFSSTIVCGVAAVQVELDETACNTTQTRPFRLRAGYDETLQIDLTSALAR